LYRFRICVLFLFICLESRLV